MNIYPVTTVTEQDVYHLALIGKRCYSPKYIDTLWNDVSCITFEKVTTFLSNLITNKHLSILEHFNFTFGVDDVTRVFTHQLVRHRHFSFAQMSNRYTKEPKIISNPNDVIYNYNTSMKEHDLKSIDLYYKLLNEGVDAEEARFVLPGTIATSIFVTGNLRTWMEFINKRSCSKAQKEIRIFAKTIHGYFMNNKWLSSLFKNESIGPECISSVGCNKYCAGRYSTLSSYLAESYRLQYINIYDFLVDK